MLLLVLATVRSQPLPGTAPLTRPGDLAARMVEGIDRYLMKKLEAPPPATGDRETLRRILGVVDARVPFQSPSLDATVSRDARIASAPAYDVFAVRWPALDGVWAEGVLLQPRAKPRCHAVVLGDAGEAPEEIAFARRMAENGCLVLAPWVLDRDDAHSGHPAARMTNQPHREFVYRMAYEMGRHIIGYEVQKTLAAVDWFAAREPALPISVYGYGEGGLIALHAAALDDRIAAAAVSGYFGPRHGVWSEPIYRNLWGQLNGYRDADLAGMAAPRALVVEASPHPSVDGPPPVRDGRRGAAPGRIATPAVEEVRAEAGRAAGNVVVVEGGPGSEAALGALLKAMKLAGPNRMASVAPKKLNDPPDPAARRERQFRQLVGHVQMLVTRADRARRDYWSRADFSSIERLTQTAEEYRSEFREEIIGRMPEPSEPIAAETRKAYDTPAFTGYEVVLPVWPEVFAYGVLLVPKDLKPGERRPVVVAQHGLEARPQHLIEPPDDRTGRVYQRYAARLAERGFVVYAPQNPYIGGERFRVLLRKAHPLKLSLFSFIVGQHQRSLDWLAELPFVDQERIGFYGFSYGGKTAMRAPPLVRRYALSICSADFNEWIWKVTSPDQPFSYMFTAEYDMLEFNLGNTFNYAEMAYLIAPRPFMVERGHKDGVGIDEWVAHEFAKVRRFYTFLGIGERAEIEFFNGPHAIHGEGTFEFLHRYLRWPKNRDTSAWGK
jgi:dienelactone hydrolase